MNKKKNKKKHKNEQLEKQRLERIELRLKILKLLIEIPLITTAIIIGIDKILKI